MPKWDSYYESDNEEFEKIKSNKPKEQRFKGPNRKDNRRELRKHKEKLREVEDSCSMED